MNFVTPRQRQEWLSRAEDYADVVRFQFSFIDKTTNKYFRNFLVSSTYEIHLTSCGTILFNINIHGRWNSYVDAMG